MFLCRIVFAVLLLTGGRAWAITPNAPELALATLITTAGTQARPAMVYDPILNMVARARARDLAKRGYSSIPHVDPDGYGPNKAVQLAGYQLPGYYGTGLDSNYIESSALGQTTASAVFTYWLNSPGHKIHVLAQHPSYAAQTRYGVGYFYDSTSTYKHYWVFISAPPNLSAYPALEPYAEWLFDRYTPKKIDQSSDADDLDGDGIPRLMEFALGFDPAKKQTMTRPKLSADGQRLEWTLTLRSDLGTVRAEVKHCADLATWTTGGVSQGSGLFWCNATGSRDFMRLSVERAH